MNRETLSVYNERAVELAEYFRGIGPRIEDINLAFRLSEKEPKEINVLELGCGDGRDAIAIVQKCRTYLGIDYSEGMLQLAQKMVPEGNFQLADIESFDYPHKAFDVVFAFAALLHLDKDAVQKTIDKVAQALKPNGIFYISNKFAEEYKEEWKTDKFGRRLFYFYNPEMITEMAEKDFDTVETNFNGKGTARWFQIGLKKHD